MNQVPWPFCTLDAVCTIDYHARSAVILIALAMVIAFVAWVINTVEHRK